LKYNCQICRKAACKPPKSIWENKKYITLFYWKTFNEYKLKDNRLVYVPYVIEVDKQQTDFNRPTTGVNTYQNNKIKPLKFSRSPGYDYWEKQNRNKEHLDKTLVIGNSHPKNKNYDIVGPKI